MDIFKFTFKPVSCHRGRKWRGDLAFYYGAQARDYSGFGTMTIPLWEPTSGKIVYANEDFVEVVDMGTEEIENYRLRYMESVMKNSVEFGKAQLARFLNVNVTESRAIQYARNLIRRNHPELVPYLDHYGLTDQRNAMDEISNTFNWASGLKTKGYYKYGKYIPGGKPLSEARKVQAVINALRKQGVDKLPGFTEAWELSLVLMGLAKYKDSY